MTFEIKFPEAGFSVAAGKVLDWKKREGDRVEKGETILSIETGGNSIDVPAESSGLLEEIRVKAGETAPVGGILGVIAMGSGDSGEKRRPVGAEGKKRKVSPLAKVLARKQGINPDGLTEGSGPGGRVVKGDVLRHIETLEKKAARPVTAAAPAAPASPGPAAGYTGRVPYTGPRRVIAERMTASVRNAPQYTMSADVDVTELSGLIDSTRGRADKPELTYLPFVMKACVAGIDLVPEVNALSFEDGCSLVGQVNIGIAVDLGGKLLVPVVRDVRAKSILRLAGEIRSLADRARSEKLEPGDTEGGTFTIEDAGVSGVHSGTPILLQPQSCIMHIGTVREEPGVVKGEIRIRKRVMIGVTVDQRIVDGGPGARFLNEVRSHLENPSRLLLSL